MRSPNTNPDEDPSGTAPVAADVSSSSGDTQTAAVVAESTPASKRRARGGWNPGLKWKTVAEDGAQPPPVAVKKIVVDDLPATQAPCEPSESTEVASSSSPGKDTRSARAWSPSRALDAVEDVDEDVGSTPRFASAAQVESLAKTVDGLASTVRRLTPLPHGLAHDGVDNEVPASVPTTGIDGMSSAVAVESLAFTVKSLATTVQTLATAVEHLSPAGSDKPVADDGVAVDEHEPGTLAETVRAAVAKAQALPAALQRPHEANETDKAGVTAPHATPAVTSAGVDHTPTVAEAHRPEGPAAAEVEEAPSAAQAAAASSSTSPPLPPPAPLPRAAAEEEDEPPVVIEVPQIVLETLIAAPPVSRPSVMDVAVASRPPDEVTTHCLDVPEIALVPITETPAEQDQSVQPADLPPALEEAQQDAAPTADAQALAPALPPPLVPAATAIEAPPPVAADTAPRPADVVEPVATVAQDEPPAREPAAVAPPIEPIPAADIVIPLLRDGDPAGAVSAQPAAPGQARDVADEPAAAVAESTLILPDGIPPLFMVQEASADHLVQACLNSQLRIVATLLVAGADPNAAGIAKTENGQAYEGITPIQAAVLAVKSGEVTPKMLRKQAARIVKLLLEHGAQVDAIERDLVMHCANHDLGEVLEVLAEHDVKLRRHAYDAIGIALHHGHVDVLRSLQKKSCPINLMNDRGSRPFLDLCSRSLRAPILPKGAPAKTAEALAQRIQNLVDCGLDLEATDKVGATALMRAVVCGNEPMALALLSLGANHHARLRNGVSVAHLAVVRNRTSFVRRLVSMVDVREDLRRMQAMNMQPDMRSLLATVVR